MKKLNIYMILLALFASNNSYSYSQAIIVSQGDTQLIYDDLDGYSYTIPPKVRESFYDDAQRLDKTLTTMLTMKHVVNYALASKILDQKLINSNVSKYLIENSHQFKQDEFSDIEYLKLKNYINLQESYKFMQKYIKNSVKEQDLLELAKEQYIVNKERYFHKELRDIHYVKIKYKEQENKDSTIVLAENLLKKLQNNSFKDVQAQYKSNQNVEFVTDIKEFYYNEKYKNFSDYVFAPNKTGLINKILEVDNYYIIAILNNINLEGYDNFDMVESSIVAELKKAKVSRVFGDLVAKLTKDKIEVNKEAVHSLRTRYLIKTQ